MKEKSPRNQLPYSLHRLTFILQRLGEEELQEKLNMGFSQFKLMIALAKHPNSEQQHLAFHLGQTEASISRQIKLMKQMGLITIEKDKKDSRRRHVNLTKKGWSVFEKAQALLEKLHRDTMTKFSDQDIKKFNSYIEKMLSGLGCDTELYKK